MPPAAWRRPGRRGTGQLSSPASGRSFRLQAALISRDDKLPLIALTSGEPAGIGPDICLRLALETSAARLAFIGDPDTFRARARRLGIDCELALIDRLADAEPHAAGRLELLPVRLSEPAVPGQPNPANAAAVIEMLRLAADACKRREVAAMVTAPVQKSTINAAGIPFSGHTELLAALTGAPKVVMMLASPRLKVALATTHLPLARVPSAITQPDLQSTLEIVDKDLRVRFAIPEPRVLVLGLNPHAGEDGVLGSEEQDTIRPVVERLKARGLHISGPVAADSAFTEASLAECDVIVAMYHDQGLPALKARDFGEIVNVSLGLPIIRTSVDHGTALALAGTGRARHASLRAALDLAVSLAARETR